VLQTGEKASVSTDGTPAKAAMLETEKAEIQSAINSIEPASAAGQQLIETLLQSFPENDALHRQGQPPTRKLSRTQLQLPRSLTRQRLLRN
jgi:hypothetical protein